MIAATASLVMRFLSAKVATGFTRDVRTALFVHIQRFSATEFDKFSTASLITRSTNDLQQIQQTLTQILRMMLIAPLMAIGALQNALTTAPSLAWIIALAVTILVSIIIVLFTFSLPKFKLLQKLVDQLNLVARQNLTGLRVIRAFNNEEYEQNVFDKVNLDLTNVNIFTNRLMALLGPIMMLVMNLAGIAVIWFGAHLVVDMQLAIGDMIAFMQYALQAISSFVMISALFIIVPRATVSVKRVGEVMQANPVIKNPKQPEQLPEIPAGTVQFKNVTFFYPHAKRPALKNISFTAAAGQTTAIIGGTGSGKSTLIRLIPRFYDASRGEVLVDSINVKQLNLEDLRSQIGFVSQKALLFSGKIRHTLTLGKQNASKKDLEKALATSQSAEFVNKLKENLDHRVSQGGSNLSGGQKQRLSIARALAKDPQILILDDSFSALDFKTDAKIRQAIKKTTEGKIVIIVSQRLSSITDANQIVVLNDNGTISGSGTHQQLLKSNSVYQEIARSQLSDKELAELKVTPVEDAKRRPDV